MGILLQAVILLLAGGLAAARPEGALFWILLAILAACAAADLGLWLAAGRKQAALSAFADSLRDAKTGYCIGTWRYNDDICRSLGSVLSSN